MTGDDEPGAADGSADTGRFKRPDPGPVEGGAEPAPAPGGAAEGEDAVAATGKFTVAEFAAASETSLGLPPPPPPSSGPSQPPPSMGIILTGQFTAPARTPAPPPEEEDPRAAATIEATRIEPPPGGYAAARAAAPSPPAAAGGPFGREAGRDDGLGGQPTEPPPERPSRRPLDPPPPSDPALTRPPAGPGGGGLLAPLLVAAACLAGIAALVRHAFPEVFDRLRGGPAAALAVRLEQAEARWRDGPVTVAGWLEGAPPGAGLAWKVEEGPAGLAGVAGVTTLGPDGRFALELGAAPEGEHALRLSLTPRAAPSAAGAPAAVSVSTTARVDHDPPLVEVLAPADGAQVTSGVVLEVRVVDASPVTLGATVAGRTVLRPEPLPGAGGGRPAVVRRPLGALPAGALDLAIVVEDAVGHQRLVTRKLQVQGGGAGPVTEPRPATEARPVTEAPPPPAAAPPRVLLAWPPGALVGPGPLAATVEGADALEVRLDGATLATALPVVLARGAVADGPHLLEVRATSKGGEAREARRIVFDGTPPALALRVPARGPSPVRIDGTVTDALDPAPRVALGIDGGAPLLVPGLPHELRMAPGAHRVRVVVRDAAGNEASETITVTVGAAGPTTTEAPPATEAPPVKVPPPATEAPPVKVPPPATEAPPVVADATPPTVELLAPTAAAAAGGPLREARVEARVVDGGEVRTIRVTLDGRPLEAAVLERGRTPQGEATRVGADLAGVPDGEHLLAVTAEDAAGNRGVAERRFALDRTPPALTLVDPSVRVFFGAADLAVRVVEAGELVRVEARLASGRAMPAARDGDVWRVRLELPPGDHEVALVAVDRAGNEGRATRAFRLDTTATAPAPNTVRIPSRSGPRLRIEGQVVEGSTVTVDGNGQRLASGRGLPLLASVGAGTWSVEVTVVAAGGARSTWRGTVEVDAAGPQLRNLRVVPTTGRRAQVTGEVVDAGPVTVQVWVGGAAVADALPCEVELGAGLTDVLVVARDDVGNETRVTRQAVPTAGAAPTPPPTTATPPPTTATPPPAAPWATTGDPREGQAIDLLARGQAREAAQLLDEVLRDRRNQDDASPYWHRAHARLAIAEALQPGDVIRTQWLNQALADSTRVLTLAAPRSAHHRFKGDLLMKLGRRTLAAEEYRLADALAAQGQ